MDSPPLHWTDPSSLPLQWPTYDDARTTRWARGRAEQRRQRGEAWFDDCGHGYDRDDDTHVAAEPPQPWAERMPIWEERLVQRMPGWHHEAGTSIDDDDVGGGRVGAGGGRGAGKPGAGVEGIEESEESWCKQLHHTLMPWTALDYNCVRTLHGWYRCGREGIGTGLRVTGPLKRHSDGGDLRQRQRNAMTMD